MCKASSTRKRFNSATAVMPWRSDGFLPDAIALLPLQFGHGCDAVEINSARASRKPTRWLQFGHGCDAVEMGLDRLRLAGVVFASIRPRL